MASGAVDRATADVHLLIGSFTHSYGAFPAAGEGLSLVALRPDSSLELLDRITGLPNPAYVRPRPAHGLAYIALENNDERNGVATIAIDGGRLRVRETTPLPGGVLCHLDIHPGGRWIAGACYGSGHVSARPLDEHGAPQPSGGTTFERRGSSIHPVRQTTSHPHAVRFSPDGRHVIVPDLGMDEIACYDFDPDTGFRDTPPRVHRAEPGSGPRLAVFSGDGRHLIVAHELSSSASSFAWEDGTLRPVSRHSALFAPHDGPNTSAGLRWHPSGRAFAVSNRGADRIAVFHFDPASGVIEPCCEHASGGQKPRDFEFMPCGERIVVANQDGHRLAVLALDLAKARMEDTGLGLDVRSPSCVRVVNGP